MGGADVPGLPTLDKRCPAGWQQYSRPAIAAMTIDLYGHMVDANRWQAARLAGGIMGASEPSEEQGQDSAHPGSGERAG